MSNPTPMSFDDAVAAVSRFSALFDGVKVIAAQVKDDRLREQVIKEADERRAKIDAEANAAQDRLNDIMSRTEAAHRNLSELGDRARDLLADAEDKAKTIRADADAYHAAMIDKAKALADALLDGANSDLSKAKSALEALNAQVASADALLASKRDDLAAIEKKISDARTMLQSFLGAK